eukprot:6204525-Pleurochrysis_carterae.AAC.4
MRDQLAASMRDQLAASMHARVSDSMHTFELVRVTFVAGCERSYKKLSCNERARSRTRTETCGLLVSAQSGSERVDIALTICSATRGSTAAA